MNEKVRLNEDQYDRPETSAALREVLGKYVPTYALASCIEEVRAALDTPPPAQRYMNHAGAMVPDPEGQWVHVKDLRANGWKLDPPTRITR